MAESVSTIGRVATIAILCIFASGCRSWGLKLGGKCRAPEGYGATAEAGEPLKIPPNLEAPDTTQALKIPELNTPAPPPRQEGDPCLEAPPSYAVPKPAPPPAA